MGDINRYDDLYGDGSYGACVIYPEFDSDVESISVEFRRSDDTLISSGTSSTSGAAIRTDPMAESELNSLKMIFKLYAKNKYTHCNTTIKN